MKRILIVVAGLVLAGVVTCGGGIAYMAYSTAELDRAGRAFVDAAVPAIVQNWSVGELEARATPELLAAKPREQRVRRFDELSRQLGGLREYEGASGQLRLSYADGVSKKGGDFVARLRFEKSRAQANVRVLRTGDGWRIDAFDVDAFAPDATSAEAPAEETVSPPSAVQAVPLRRGDLRDAQTGRRPACRSARGKVVFDALSIGPTVVVGSPAMWPHEIELGIERQRASLDRCAAAPVGSPVTGKASWLIGPTGATSAVEVTSASAGFPVRCVSEAIAAWRFAEPVAGGEVRVRGYALIVGGAGPVTPLTYAAVKSAFESQRSLFLGCRRWARARVKLVVQPDGKVATVDISEASPADDHTVSCLRLAVERLRFPPLECGDRLDVEASLTN